MPATLNEGYNTAPIPAGSAFVEGDANRPGTSWGAIFAGATATAALSYILLMLGFGFGLLSVSPWGGSGASATAVGIVAIAWLAFTQIVASAMGGYLAGRLRVKWAGVHTDEVFFRDTAHGFLSWAVAALVTAAFMASAIGSIFSAGAAVGGETLKVAASAGGAAVGQAAGSMTARDGHDFSYYVDSLMRKNPSSAVATDPQQPPVASANDGASRAEIGRIFINDLKDGQLNAQDKQYAAQVVAAHTGISQAEAEQRIDAAFNKAKQTIEDAKTTAKKAADAARKTAAYSTLWLFITLLLGAFFASLAATLGGRSRDRDAVLAMRGR